MTDTLTICARAIIQADHDAVEDGIDPTSPRWAELLARACLTALAEKISEEMVEAGADATKDKLARWQVEQIVRSAIAAAKGEGQ